MDNNPVSIVNPMGLKGIDFLGAQPSKYEPFGPIAAGEYQGPSAGKEARIELEKGLRDAMRMGIEERMSDYTSAQGESAESAGAAATATNNLSSGEGAGDSSPDNYNLQDDGSVKVTETEAKSNSFYDSDGKLIVEVAEDINNPSPGKLSEIQRSYWIFSAFFGSFFGGAKKNKTLTKIANRQWLITNTQ